MLTKVEIAGYTTIDGIYLKSDGDEVEWSISPSLPSSLSLSSSTGIIVGKATTIIPETQFVIKATNSVGSSNSSFSLTVLGCSYGDYLYPHFKYTARGTFILRKDTQVYYNQTLTKDSATESPICVPRLHYEYEFFCDSTSACYFFLLDEQGLYYLSSLIYQNETERGYFEIIPTKAPLISFPSLVTAYDGETLNVLIKVDGVHGSFNVTPSLPKDVEITGGVMTLSGRVSKPLYEEYTLTTSNSVGSGSLSFILAVDVCPPGLTLMTLKLRRHQVYERWKVLNSDNEVLFDQTRDYRSDKHNICWSPGSYQFVLSTTDEEGGWMSSVGLNVYDERGVLGEFRLEEGEREMIRHFNFEVGVPEGSEWMVKYGYVSGDWRSGRFNDKKWLRGKDGLWGKFSSDVDVLYLRKKLNVDDLSKYSHVHLDVKRSSDCEVMVYVNGDMMIWREGESVDGYARSTFPVSILKSSTILAVEIRRASDSPETSEIVFDLHAIIVSTSCILQSMNGKASDSEGSSVVHGPAYAFDLNRNNYWEPSSLPVTLRYRFGNEMSVIVNKAILYSTERDIPSSLRIEGVNEDNSTVVLYSMKSLTFLRNGEEVMYFENSQPFSSYQFVFESSVEGKTFRVYDARFYSCTDRNCGKKGRYDSSYPGTTRYGKCPLMSVGVNQMHCEEGDVDVKWREDRSVCLKQIPSQEMAYIDWSFVIVNLTRSDWNKVSTNMISLLTKHLKVSEEEIDFALVRDTSDSTRIELSVLCRFSVEYEIGDYLFKHLKLLVPKFNELVKEYLEVNREVSGWIEEIHLREPIPVGSIVLVCVTTVIVLLIVGLGYLIRVRMLSKKSRKSLKRLRKGEEANLLESVLFVC